MMMMTLWLWSTCSIEDEGDQDLEMIILFKLWSLSLPYCNPLNRLAAHTHTHNAFDCCSNNLNGNVRKCVFEAN